MDRGAWKAAVHGVAEGQTQLSDFTFTFHFHALEKKMAPHSSVLASRIPGMREPGGHGVIKSQTRLSDFTFTFCLARLSEMVILSADDWVCIFVLFVV